MVWQSIRDLSARCANIEGLGPSIVSTASARQDDDDDAEQTIGSIGLTSQIRGTLPRSTAGSSPSSGPRTVREACTRVEAAVHRPVSPTILTRGEFAAPSGFLDNVRSGPAVAVIGELPWR